MKKTVISLLVYIFAFNTHAWAWWSVPANFNGSTHHRITTSAEYMLGSDYYDVAIQFSGSISNWTSGSSDDAEAHGGTVIPNGGKIENHWKNALEQYKSLNFANGEKSAYYYIALMIHLIEDQGVPAHAYDIRHGGIGYMDNMEQLVNYSFSPTSVEISPSDDPIGNYDAMHADTLDFTTESNWRAYWKSSPTYQITVDGTIYYFQGVYGGPASLTPDQYDQNLYLPTDVFPSSSLTAGAEENKLAQDLTGMAVSNAAGALMAISQNLPPLAKDLAIDGSTDGAPAINTETGSNITFNLYENRQPDVYVTIAVDSPDGPAIVDADSGMPVSYVQRNLGNGAELPYEGPFAATWKGNLADGSELSSGQHTLYVVVYDHDGNVSPEYTITFTLNTPPTVVSTGPADGASSVSASGPITVTFDRPMDSASVNGAITLSASGSNCASSSLSPSWPSDSSVSLTPSPELTPNCSYTVTVSDNATDADGNQLDGDKDGQAGGNYSFSFSTGQPPKVSSTAPASGATGVSLSDPVTVAFDQEMDAVTVSPSTITISPSVSGALVA